MTKLLLIILSLIVATFLISQGLHPALGVLLFIYRKATLRICLFLGVLYWLTQGIL